MHWGGAKVNGVSGGGSVFKQIILFKNTKEPHQMYNQSSQNPKQFSSEQSQEMIPGKTYIRKKKKKIRQQNFKSEGQGVRKKKCEKFDIGNCYEGRHCSHSHSYIPEIAKKICKKHIFTTCQEQENCHYSHNTKKYPCKFFHLQGICEKGNYCQFSHMDLNSDSEKEFLTDNEGFLKSIYKKELKIRSKYAAYIEEKVRDSQDHPNQSLEQKNREEELNELPEFFWLPLRNTSSQKPTSTEDKNLEMQGSARGRGGRRGGQRGAWRGGWRGRGKGRGRAKTYYKPVEVASPFTIRLMAKKREQIPEKLPWQLVNSPLCPLYSDRLPDELQMEDNPRALLAKNHETLLDPKQIREKLRQEMEDE